MTEDCIGRICDTDAKNEKCRQDFVGKFEWNRQLGTARRRYENNIKVNIKDFFLFFSWDETESTWYCSH
jgi:hypothetical protein